MKKKNFKVIDKIHKAINNHYYIEAILLLVQNYEDYTINKLKPYFRRNKIVWSKTRDEFIRLRDYNVGALMYYALINNFITLEEHIEYKQINKLRNTLAHNILKNRKISAKLVKKKIVDFMKLTLTNEKKRSINEKKRLAKQINEMQEMIKAMDELRQCGEDWYMKKCNGKWKKFKLIK